MNALRVGSVLLQKYRIDRHALEGRDVSLYDATDLSQASHVCVKVFRTNERFERDVCGPRVVDVGSSEGLPYVVVGDAECSLRHRSKPPPLPERAKRKSSKPPPLPRRPSAPPIPVFEIPVVEIPVLEAEPIDVEPSTLDEAIVVASLKPPLPRIVWAAVVLVAVLAGLAGWYAREMHLQHAGATPAARGPSAPALLAARPIAEPSLRERAVAGGPATVTAVTAPAAATAATTPDDTSARPSTQTASRAAHEDPLTL